MPRQAGNSAKAQRDQLRDRMRALGCAPPQIAAEMGRRFKLRPRVAWRHALGWPQWKVAQQYNTLHPGARLSDHRVSEYESWPHGGSPPSPRYLAMLATTFGHGCTPAQLVDADDLEHLIPADRCLLTNTGYAPAMPITAISTSPRRAASVRPPLLSQPDSELAVPADVSACALAMSSKLPDTLATLLMSYLESLAPAGRGKLITPRERDHAYHQLVQFLRSWAHTMDRRDVLRLLGWAATAASAFPALNDDEQQRLAAVISTPSRVDAQTIEHIEAVLWRCRQQDYALGPQAALDTVLAQRNLARVLVTECPDSLRPRMLSALSEASRQAGWLSFDLKQFDNAGYYYEDARARAHEAQNVGLGAFVLCQMSQLATWQNKPRIGIDHAVAAEQWAHRSGDIRLHAFVTDVTARAYAADGQRAACLTALEAAPATLTMVDDHTPVYGPLYDEALRISFRGECHLRLGDADGAVSCAQQSLRTLDQSRARDMAMTIVDLGEAYVLRKEIDEAARLLGDAGEIAARNSSARLSERLKQGRAELRPWEHAAAVRQLDDRFAAYDLA
jgi:tetratricopeptide (TPR) repeat protein